MILAFMLLLLSSCRQESQPLVNGIKICSPINQLLLNNKKEIDDVDSTFVYIPLETNEQCYLGKIDKMRVLGNKIFLNDKTSKALFCFSTSGKFLFKINAVGKGPGEYLGIYDFDVSDEYIILLDPNGYKLLMFDLDGQFVKEKKLRYSALRAVCIYKHNIYAYTYSTPRQDEELKKNWLVVYDNNFKAIKRIEVPELSYLSRHTRIPDCFIKKGDELLFTKSYDKIIYRVTEDGLRSYLEMNFLRIPEEIQSLRQLFKDKQAVFYTGRINAVNDSLLFMQFGHNGKRYELVYNDFQKKMYGNGMQANHKYIKGYTNNMMFLSSSSIRCSSDDRLYTLCEIRQVKSKAALISAMEKMSDNVDLIHEIMKLDELQNPVIFCNAYCEK